MKSRSRVSLTEVLALIERQMTGYERSRQQYIKVADYTGVVRTASKITALYGLQQEVQALRYMKEPTS